MRIHAFFIVLLAFFLPIFQCEEEAAEDAKNEARFFHPPPYPLFIYGSNPWPVFPQQQTPYRNFARNDDYEVEYDTHETASQEEPSYMVSLILLKNYDWLKAGN